MTVALEALVGDRRVTARISDAAAEAMGDVALSDGLPVSDQIAALADLWISDPELRQRATSRAREINQQRRRERYGRSP